MKTTTRHLRLVRNDDEQPSAQTPRQPPRSPRFVMGASGSSRLPDMDERELVKMARKNDRLACELLMRRHNQRLFRVVRSVLEDNTDVEDVLRHAYLRAFAQLDQFDGTIRWPTWIGRIALHEALARLRGQRGFDTFGGAEEPPAMSTPPANRSAFHPRHGVGGHESGMLLELAIDRLPGLYRVVLILRDVEGMTAYETAELLGVGEDMVKNRLHRARRALRESMKRRVSDELHNCYVFVFERSDRLVNAVLTALDG